MGGIKERMSILLRTTTFRNGATFTIYSVLNKTINFVLLFVIANYVSPEGYGKIDLFNTTVLLLGYFISLNTTSVISVNYFSYSTQQLRESISCVLILTLLGGLVFGSCILFSSSISSVIGLRSIFILYAIVVSVSNVVYDIILNIWRLEENLKQYGIYSIGIVFINFVLTLVFIVHYKLGWTGRVYAQVLSYLILAIVGAYALLKKNLIVFYLPNKDIFLDSLRFGLPLIPHSISFWLRQGLDRYLINFFYSSSVLGCYSFALNFANIIQMLGTALNATYSVTIYKKLAENDVITVRSLLKNSRIVAFVFTILTVIIVCVSFIFIPVFFPNYYDSLSYLIFLSIGALAQCIYLLYVNYIFYYKKTKVLMYITFSTSLLHAILSIIVARYSLMYVAVLNALTNIVIMLLVYIYTKKLIKQHFR